MSPTQAKVVAALKEREPRTLEELLKFTGRGYYHNANKHFGKLLGNMVERGMIQRGKRGVFILPKRKQEPAILVLECLPANEPPRGNQARCILFDEIDLFTNKTEQENP